MNKQEQLNKLESIKEEIKHLIKWLDKFEQSTQQEEKKEFKRWKPEVGDIYFWLCNEGDIRRKGWADHSIDLNRFKFGNCYQTTEEAGFAREKQLVEVKLQDFALKYNEGITEYDDFELKPFGLLLDKPTNTLSKTHWTGYDPGTVPFKDENFLSSMPEDLKQRLIKYKFGVK